MIQNKTKSVKSVKSVTNDTLEEIENDELIVSLNDIKAGSHSIV